MVEFCAEIGSMHKQSVPLALEMARQAAEAGAGIVKMQFGWPKSDGLRHVNPDMARAVAAYCEDLGVEFMASIWSRDGLALARAVGMKRYKIAHQKAEDAGLVAEVLADGKPVFVSRLKPLTALGQVTQVYTTDEYPTLRPRVPEFGRDWQGYSDHCLGIEACLLACARGAGYVEKHFCLDKTDMGVRDTPLSATPAEFAEMVRLGKGIARAAGHG